MAFNLISCLFFILENAITHFHMSLDFNINDLKGILKYSNLQLVLPQHITITEEKYGAK